MDQSSQGMHMSGSLRIVAAGGRQNVVTYMHGDWRDDHHGHRLKGLGGRNNASAGTANQIAGCPTDSTKVHSFETCPFLNSLNSNAYLINKQIWAPSRKGEER